MNVVIRRIELADSKAYYAALCKVASERKYLLTITPRPFHVMDAFVRSNVENDHAHYVADLNGAIVGWADIVPLTRETMTHAGALGMAVLSAYRGKGIGQRLLKEALKHAWEKGLTRIELEVFSDNPVAVHLYKRQGFEIEGTKRFARYVDGKYQDIIVMAQYRV